jgi:hypothetical protein
MGRLSVITTKQPNKEYRIRDRIVEVVNALAAVERGDSGAEKRLRRAKERFNKAQWRLPPDQLERCRDWENEYRGKLLEAGLVLRWPPRLDPIDVFRSYVLEALWYPERADQIMRPLADYFTMGEWLIVCASKHNSNDLKVALARFGLEHWVDLEAWKEIERNTPKLDGL